ncbi:hypothetical protein FJTKL_13240 [Diaporthe vaccinii]|uniref:Uncharacterized protein n=1 Tax=Diaporthe vaccinii TaxID=105482 RepID=A0ABR4EB71_9PEZI
MNQASVKFLKWTPLYEEEKPFQIFGDLLEESVDKRKTNLTWEEAQIQVQDLRDDAQSYRPDSHGFAVCHLPGFTQLSDRAIISDEYIPVIKKMLKAELEDVGTMFAFGWRIRESNSEVKAGSRINFGDQTQPLLPSNYAHIDTSPISVIQRIQQSFPNDEAKILRQRVRAVKYPLTHPVDEWPLAVCDGTTVSPDDLIETDSIRQGSVSTHYYVRHNPGQRWYFLNRQTPEEALIFKHFDSKPGVEAPYTIHSSIKQLWPVENPRPRQSIECSDSIPF